MLSDKIEKDRLYLTWLSCKDFGALARKENQRRLKYVWRRVGTQTEFYFKDWKIPFDSILMTFKRINLNIDPRQPCGYDPQKEALLFNLWALLFDPVDKEYCISSLPIRTGGQFVHEFDHYCFFKEHNMIGKTGEKYDEFNKKELGQLEKRAFLSQINFFERCKTNIPDNLRNYRIKVTKWSKNGKPIESQLKEFSFRKEDLRGIVDAWIKDLFRIISQIGEGESYSKKCSENTINEMEEIASLLALPIKLDPNKQNYPSVVLEI